MLRRHYAGAAPEPEVDSGLEAMTKKELVDLGALYGLKLDPKALKVDLLAALTLSGVKPEVEEEETPEVEG